LTHRSIEIQSLCYVPIFFSFPLYCYFGLMLLSCWIWFWITYTYGFDWLFFIVTHHFFVPRLVSLLKRRILGWASELGLPPWASWLNRWMKDDIMHHQYLILFFSLSSHHLSHLYAFLFLCTKPITISIRH
jgi:hypothetical protein